MKKLGIYDPYLHILGGAERYVLTIAKCLSTTHEITVFTDNHNLVNQAENKFGLHLPKIKIISWAKQSDKRFALLKKLRYIFICD